MTPAVPARTVEVPAWLRRTPGEVRLPVTLSISGAIVLQLVLPDGLAIRPHWLLPGIEIALLVGITTYDPLRLARQHPLARLASRGLIAVLTIANATSAAFLIHNIVNGHGSNDPISLLGNGAAIYITNIVAFGLWFWEFDRGGPFARAEGLVPHPDFLFPQMAEPAIAHPDWEPTFLDYLYVSFTNATAFSPTDTMPLSRWAKGLMALQSVIALSAVVIVVARAVSVLH